ncbi:MAG: ATP cone domain-containing protein [Candidatus Thermoplasmatota archaeon]|nr:ATP cone domain-containing protein [Candidatus Thermoplasmatota archaeon]
MISDQEYKIKKIIKRDGSEAEFEKSKISRAIYKAMLSVKTGSMKEAEEIADKVIREVEKETLEPTVEQIQDRVETVLMAASKKGNRYNEVAKAYILYRERRRTIREEKERLGVKDDLKLSINAIKTLEARYLLKDEEGKIIETPTQMFRRVATHIGIVELLYDYRTYQRTGKLPKNGRVIGGLAKTHLEILERAFNHLVKEKELKGTLEEFMEFAQTKPTSAPETIDKYYDMMCKLEFIPNSPTLMNAGARLGQLSACFVLPVGDSIEEIFDSLKYQAMIHKSGGGTGFSFSRLRERDDLVGSTKGVASGPVSFMKIFDTTTDVIKQGGKRRGANMGIMRYDHPDIMDFITSKDSENTILSNFNISVGLTDEFFEKLDEDDYIELRSPRSGKIVKRIKARTMWETIVNKAWQTADPGLIFLDEINRKNPVRHIADIEATNPCITGDMHVFTANGIMKAADLYRNGSPVDVVTDNRNSRKKLQHASNMIMTGVKPVIKLRTKEGFSIRLTKDHLVFSHERGWIKSDELMIGEKIRILNNGGGFGKEGGLEEGRVLGWLVGDGHINNGPGNKRAVLSLYDSDRPLAQDFAGYVNGIIRPALNNREYEVSVVNVESRNLSSVASERLREYALQVGLEETKLKVPDLVMAGNEEMQKGFLQALFEADGTVSGASGSRHSVRLASISEELLEEVQLLLLNFGIYSRIYRNRKPARLSQMPGPDRALTMYQFKPYHDLVITGRSLLTYAEKIGFLSGRKAEKLDKVVESYTRGPYKESWIATVESKEDDGVEEVFDLIEPNSHSFVANGIVIHNCGEQPLMPYEPCNLGSINLGKFVKDGEIDWVHLKEIIQLSTRFLDNVIDANKFPVDKIEKMARTTRKIGLGYMGFADLLVLLGIPYNSGEGLEIGERVMSFLDDESHAESTALAEERGVFPGWHGSTYEMNGVKMRNSTTTTIAPTGTISIIANCSSSIEPLFAIAFVRHVLNGQELMEVNPIFEGMLKDRNLYSEDLMHEVARSGNLHGIDLPGDIKRIFVTAHEIDPEWHVLMQATFQRYCDSGVSKTINLPSTATPDDIAKAYIMAHELHCKGITVYRDNSKSVQVLYSGTKSRMSEKNEAMEKKKPEAEKQTIELLTKVPDKYLKLDATFDPACPTGKCDK